MERGKSKKREEEYRTSESPLFKRTVLLYLDWGCACAEGSLNAGTCPKCLYCQVYSGVKLDDIPGFGHCVQLNFKSRILKTRSGSCLEIHVKRGDLRRLTLTKFVLN